MAPDQAGIQGTTNGAAMRATPVGIANPSGDGLIDAVVQASRVTHNTSLGIAAASAIAAAVSAGLDGAELGAALDEAERAADKSARHGQWVPGGEIRPGSAGPGNGCAAWAGPPWLMRPPG